MRLNADIEQAGRVALTLAGLPAAEQARILKALLSRMDRGEALARRDRAMRDAHTLIGVAPGSVRILARALGEFYARAWPQMRHLADPPADATPLRRACFFACQAATDAGADIPGERQIRRILL